MGQRHNRRRLRGQGRQRQGKANYHQQQDIIEGEDLAHCMPGMDFLVWEQLDWEYDEDLREAALPSPLDEYVVHECTFEELEEAQQRLFGGEVGDEHLVKLGILSDEPRSTDDRRPFITTPDSPPSDDILPRFRSRSGSTSLHPAGKSSEGGIAETDQTRNGATTDEEDWDIINSTTWESESEAWEILSDDS